MSRPAKTLPAKQRQAQEERLRSVWANPQGWRYWTTVNNTQIGLWYASAAFAFMLFAGVLALLVRLQLAVPQNDLFSADFFNQAFTLHGTVMMFLFAVPIFEAVAIFLLPPMLGARELPFPRLGAFGFWSFFLGGVFVCGSIFFDAAPSSGWFMYPPLATDEELSGIGADIWLLGLSFIEVASIAAAVELIVGIMKCRAPGMRINLMPLFAWYLLIVAGMILFAFPPLIAGDILFEMQRMFDWPFFDAERGGDPLLWQHLFWIFGHPEVYIIFLPAIALMAMIVPTFSQRPIVGYSWIVLAAVGTGFLSFGLWVHHMFTTGLPQISLAFFSAASEAVAIPTGVQIFVFIATMLAGRVIVSTPMLFGIGGLATFIIGGLTGVMVALAPFDWQAHDTYFVVAHLHYVLIGGMLFPVTAGIYYYYPLINARQLSDRLGTIAFWLMFAGFNVAFFPMHLTGLRGMPRRVFTYPADVGWDMLNLVSTVGAFVFASGILVVVLDVLRPKHRQPRAQTNPWNAGTLEWISEPEENWGVRSIPLIESRYPLWDQNNLARDVNGGRFYLADAEEGRREGLVTSVLDAKPQQVLRVGGTSYVTIVSAFALGAVFIALTFHWWIVAAASGIVSFCAILWWLWTGTAEVPEKQDKGCRPWPHLAALRVGSGIGRMVGNVHHHGRRCHGICQPCLQLFLLLDDPPGLYRGNSRTGFTLALNCRAVVRLRMDCNRDSAPAEQPGSQGSFPDSSRWRLRFHSCGLGCWLCRTLALRDGADPTCLPGHRLDLGAMDVGACSRWRGDAALLLGAQFCRTADPRARHRYP